MAINRFAVVVSLALSFTLLAPCAAAVVNVQLALNSAGSDASPKGWCDGENSYGKGYTFYGLRRIKLWLQSIDLPGALYDLLHVCAEWSSGLVQLSG